MSLFGAFTRKKEEVNASPLPLSKAFHVLSVENNEIFNNFNKKCQEWFDAEYEYNKYRKERWEERPANGMFQKDLEVNPVLNTEFRQDEDFTGEIIKFLGAVFPNLKTIDYDIRLARLRSDPTPGNENAEFHMDDNGRRDAGFLDLKNEVTMILSLTETSLPYTVYLDDLKNPFDCDKQVVDTGVFENVSKNFRRLKFGDIAIHKTSVCHSSPIKEPGISREIMILSLVGNNLGGDSLCELMALNVNPLYGEVSNVTPLRL